MSEHLELQASYYFDLSGFPYPELFEGTDYVWEVLPRIKQYALDTIKPTVDNQERFPGVTFKGRAIEIGQGTVIEAGAFIAEPTIIGRNCEIRHGAYLRGSIILADHVVIGHASEVKNSVFFSRAKAPHFNYVGDCLVGSAANLGAGTKLSNVKILESPVTVRYKGNTIETGLRKFGAILGDQVQTGCNSVLNPGCLIGPQSMVYPNVTASGWYACGSIVKPAQKPTVLQRRT
ncbi:glucose-1-phosphate thymidylyltransferase [bacterium]|nr:glucose-1-phosphate thymidylyltransferase [bacterium]